MALYARLRNRWLFSRLGYSTNQLGIMQRFLREQENWEAHLDAARQVIINEVSASRPETVSVLGSGWLLDVPLAELLGMGVKQIWLYDICHPARIKRKFHTDERIRFAQFDLTLGAVDAVIDYLKRPDAFAQSLLLKRLESRHEAPYLHSDLVVSVNTLSQLHLPLIERIAARAPKFAFPKEKFSELIQQRHIQSLPRQRSLLITEFEEEHYTPEGKLLVVKPRIHVSLNGWKRLSSWQWTFDTKGAYLDDVVVKMNVAAYRH